MVLNWHEKCNLQKFTAHFARLLGCTCEQEIVFIKDEDTLHVIFQKGVKTQNISNDIFYLKLHNRNYRSRRHR